MQKNKTKDIIVIGFALFAIFFGAGNLIFPPYLGAASGDSWAASALGFLTTDPIFPIIGVIATAMVGGMADDLGKRISRKFSIFLGAVSMLIIGPFFAVPRTGATTHEIFTVQVFGDGTMNSIPPVVTSVIFFGVSLFLVINPTKVIDIIGKFLTPFLILIIVAAIVIALFNPPGAPVEYAKTGQALGENLYITGFREGFQTMDALGSALMSGIVVTDLINKGYTEREEQFKATVGVGIVAGILLAIVYGGLTFVGSTVSDQFQDAAAAGDRVTILVGAFNALFGSTGKLVIGIAVALACLTTSVGLTSTAGNFFSRVFGKEGDIKTYRIIVSVCLAISFAISLIGVAGIIKVAVPILLAVFPVYMVLFLVTLFDSKLKYDWSYLGAVIVVACISIPEGLMAFFGMQGITPPSFIASLVTKYANLPLANFGLNWLIPGICGAIVFTVISAVAGIGGRREK